MATFSGDDLIDLASNGDIATMNLRTVADDELELVDLASSGDTASTYTPCPSYAASVSGVLAAADSNIATTRPMLRPIANVMTRTSNNQLGSIPLNGTRQWTASGYDENELARLRDLLASIHSIPVYEDGGQPMVEELQDRIETLRHDITTTAIDEYAEWHDVTLDIESSEAQQSALRATIERTEHELHEVERDFQSLMREATTAAQRHWGRFKKLIREITKRDKEIADLRAIIRDQAITRENERRAKDDVIDALRAALDIAGASTTQ